MSNYGFRKKQNDAKYLLTTTTDKEIIDDKMLKTVKRRKFKVMMKTFLQKNNEFVSSRYY